MARLKFLVFALVVLGLWGYHLTMIAPLAVTSSQEAAQSAVVGAAAPVAVALESQRSLTQAVALKVATSGAALWNAGPKAGAKPEAPTVDRFASVRSVATEAVPAELKEQLFVAVSNEVGLLAAKGSGEPASAAPEGLDLAEVAQAGGAGSVKAIDGTSYLLFAAPLAISDKNEVRQAGSVVVGLPVLPTGKFLEQTQKGLALSGLALVADGKPVQLAGDKAAIDGALAKVKAGASSAIASGPVRELGPLALPLMVDNPVHAIGARQAIAGTPFEVVAVAASRAALDALAGYQVFALGGLVGLLLLTIVFTLLMGSQHEEGPAMVLPPPMPIPPRKDEAGTTGVKPAFTPAPEPEPLAPPEASPDDFHFPASPSAPPAAPPASSPSAFSVSSPSSITGAAPAFEPESDPFASSAPPPAPPPPAPPAPPPPAPPPPLAARPPPPIATSEAPAFQPARGLMDDDEGQRTVAYPAFKPPPAAAPPPPPVSDPFALAAAQQEDAPPMGEDNPDATRVAAVPAELIKAARAGASGNTGERPALKPASMPRVAAVAPAGGGAAEEERHFQDVFRDFVATREKCREPSDGLTYDKFKAKLLKNKEQLVAKYQCRTVRFQVYVKDGKAALKATPVKD
ncbi:MAG: MXAN_5187 C-terminal domain-containing protein [Myxococcota bacterium]